MTAHIISLAAYRARKQAETEALAFKLVILLDEWRRNRLSKLMAERKEQNDAV